MKLCSMQLEYMWTCDHIRDPKMNHYGPSVCHKTGGAPCQLVSPKAYCIPDKDNRVKIGIFFCPRQKYYSEHISNKEMHILLILWANPHAIVYLFHVILYAETPYKCISWCWLYKPNQLSGTGRMGQYHDIWFGKKETGHLIVYIVKISQQCVTQRKYRR